MSLAAAASLLLTSTVTATALPVEKPHSTLDFTLYRPAQAAPGYSLTQAVLFAQPDGRKTVRLTYTNPQSRNQFDLVQAPARGEGSESHMRSILDKREVQLELWADTTFVTLRRGKVDMAFVGTLVSEPSALQLLKNTQPWPKQN
jgi:hypothetical protein